MLVWLVQRAESTPHDAQGKRRLMRVGILAQLLAERGHEVVWWTSGFDHVSKAHRVDRSQVKEVSENYRIHYIQTLGYRKNISFRRLIDNWTLTKNFRREIANASRLPNIILASMPSVELSKAATEFGEAKGIPVALDIRDLYPDVFADLLPRAVKLLVKAASHPMRKRVRATCSKATAILGITEGFVDWGIEHASRERGDDDRVFSMAYARAKVSDADLESASKFWSSRPLMERQNCLHGLFLGTFTNSFDFDTLISAARILAQRDAAITFTFCGVGPKEDEIRAATSDLPNCDIVGWVDGPQIEVALSRAHVGLAPYVPSINFLQNIPNKPAEYMSKGLIIASALEMGRLADLLLERSAGFVYGRDALVLADRLSDLSVDAEERGKMSKASARTFSEKFAAEQVYATLINHLEELAKKKLR